MNLENNTFHPPANLEELLGNVNKEIAVLREDSVWAAYVRVSVYDPKHPGYSLDTQPDKAEEYARAHDAKNVIVYSDPDFSGKNSARDGFQRMLKDIKAGKIDVVVVHRIDRLYRNLESLFVFIRLLKKYKVNLVSVIEEIDTQAWWGRIVLAVLASLAESYVYQTSANTRTGLTARRERGMHLGHLSLGYCNGLCSVCADTNGEGYCPRFGEADRPESKRGRLAVPHPIERYAIPLIFDLYLQGLSYSEVADYLNSHQIDLPEGGKVIFRPRKSASAKTKIFQRDNIRGVLENPFYTGMLARYSRPEFDTTDDVEHPENIPVPRAPDNPHEILELYQGRHQALIAVETWQAVEALRHQKASTPTRASNPRRIYPLTGVSRCWECFTALGQDFNLRGSTGKNITYYRCAHLHDRALTHAKKKQPDVAGGYPVSNQADDELIQRHASLRSDKIQSQVDALVTGLVIPKDWYEIIMAYYLTDEGMTEFEREGYNLRQSLQRYKDLYLKGDISKGEYEQQSRFIMGRLDAQKPLARPAAREILPLLEDFPSIWLALNAGEQRQLLSIVFAALYFDHTGRLRRVVANEPFDELLGLPEDGLMP